MTGVEAPFDVYTSLRSWLKTVKCRINEIKSLENQKKEHEKQRLQQAKNIVNNTATGVQLFNLGNALVWWFSIEKIQNLLEYVQIIWDSIANKADLAAIRTISTSKEIINHVKVKYIHIGSLVEATLNAIQNVKEPKNTCEAINNIEHAIRDHSSITSAR